MATTKTAPGSKTDAANGLRASVDRKALTEVLTEVARTATLKGTLPILSNVLLVATDDGYLSFSSTDLNRQVTAKLPGTVSVAGRTSLHARTLAEWVKIQDQDTTIHFALEQASSSVAGKCTVSCGRASMKLSTIPAEDWPTGGFTDFAAATEFSIGSQELKEAIHLTTLCAAPDDTRPVLAGILIRIANKRATFAAADGFRLAVREMELGADLDNVEVVAPASCLEELAKLIGAEDAPTHIALDAKPTFVRFETPSYTVFSRTIEGQFPDYQRIIPKEPKTIVQAARETLVRGTRAALCVAEDHAVRFTRSSADNGTACLVIASTALEGSALDEASATFIDQSGEPVNTIALNGKYILEMLRAMPTETVQWHLTAPGSPPVLRPMGSNGYVQVLMPMHVPSKGA